MSCDSTVAANVAADRLRSDIAHIQQDVLEQVCLSERAKRNKDEIEQLHSAVVPQVKHHVSAAKERKGISSAAIMTETLASLRMILHESRKFFTESKLLEVPEDRYQIPII